MKHLKSVFIFLMLFLFAVSENSLHAQFLKNVLNSVKNTVQGRANNDASSTTNKIIDKVDGSDKSKTKSTGSTATTSPADTIPKHTQTQSSTSGSGNNSNAAQQNNPYNSDGSFISLNLSSDRIIAGGLVQITGSSFKYQNFNSVAVTIAAADGSRKESRTLPLDTSGAYSTMWQLNTDDSYTVTAKSSDGKNTVSRDLGVYKAEDIDSVIAPLKTDINKASDKLMADVDQVMNMLASTDASELKKKVDAFTEKKNQALKQLDDIATAGKGLVTVQKEYGPLPTPVLQNLSVLANTISKQTNTMEQAMQAADHKPSDNSICEYLVIVSEACAAFSTFMSFEGTLLKTVNNIAGGKIYSSAAGNVTSDGTGSNGAGKAASECSSLFISSSLDGKSLMTNASLLSFGGDVAQMCSDLLLKKYCVVMSGDLTQKYEVTYRNKNNDVWWNYTYTTEATINLRYPKNNAGGNIIKMKGNIDGNATKFTIYQNAQQMDDYKTAMKGREGLTKFYSLCLHKPIAAPFSAAKMDQLFGFGAVARTVATPACFNIPIDADYDVENKKVTVYVNNALIDFTSVVCYIYGYISIAAGIPLVTRVNYPIQPVKLTLGKAIKENNGFNVKIDAKNNLSIDGKGETQIGDESSSIEHHISFSFNLKE